MKSRKSLTMVLAVSLMALILPVAAMAAGVSVECAYTAADLVCYVYTDTGTDSLLSGGVKLTYNTGELSNPSAAKNEADWYFGDSATPTPYMDPETATAGEVVFIVGKLDSAAPTAGVTGTRVLVGTVTFDRATTTVPVVDPGTTFGIALDVGRVAPYVNFASTTGVDLDPPTLSAPVVARRGDANASGGVSISDMGAVRNLILSGEYRVYADANGDGSVTISDMGAVRNIILGL